MIGKIRIIINDIINKFNNIIEDNKEHDSIMNSLYYIIMIIVIAYIISKVISIFNIHINYTF